MRDRAPRRPGCRLDHYFFLHLTFPRASAPGSRGPRRPSTGTRTRPWTGARAPSTSSSPASRTRRRRRWAGRVASRAPTCASSARRPAPATGTGAARATPTVRRAPCCWRTTAPGTAVARTEQAPSASCSGSALAPNVPRVRLGDTADLEAGPHPRWPGFWTGGSGGDGTGRDPHAARALVRGRHLELRVRGAEPLLAATPGGACRGRGLPAPGARERTGPVTPPTRPGGASRGRVATPGE